MRLLIAAASVFAFLAIFTTWIDRQALDTGEWTQTSGKLLKDQAVRSAVSDYAVEQLYSNVNVQAELQKHLPADLKPLSAPLAGGLRQFATTAANNALQTSRVQGSWEDANRRAHKELLAILEDKNSSVSTNNGEVVLDLRPLVGALAARIGLQNQVRENLPQDVAQLRVARSDQLDTARQITSLVKGLAWLFSIGTLVLFGLAVYLARGRRWMVVLGYGIGLIVAGIAALAVRKITGGLVVDQLVTSESARPAAESTWSIGTSLLKTIAIDVIIYGALFVIASFLASPAPAAATIRQAVAPSLRDRPAIVWGIFGGLALIFLIIFPPASGRGLLVALLLIGIAAAGLEALRRRTGAEFPDARKGEWRVRMSHRAKHLSSEAGRRIGSAIGDITSDREPEDAHIERLEKLGELKKSGVLTAAEFKAEKERLLGAPATAKKKAPKKPASKSA